MARPRVEFGCRECGARAPKWSGQCPECGAWNALEEQPAAAAGTVRRFVPGPGEARVLAADEVGLAAETVHPIGIGELDRVLGGGLVPGAAVLIGGEPGIGKSTLLLQALARCAGGPAGVPLYVTGEESLRQVMLRARRLGLSGEGLRLLAETRVEAVIARARDESAGVMVIDSIQTMYTDAVASAPGGVAQVREAAARLVRFAKSSATTVLLVGHVTKEGALAGPRLLEHMVDAVLYFESERDSRFRIVRAVKNRFGAANEIGIFAMTERGLREVRNPSAIFLSRAAGPTSGSAVTVIREGTRPLLVEIQALVDGSPLGNPRRVAVGLDGSRMAMLLAVLHRHAGVSTHDQDVFVNVVGGVRVAETAADLPLLLAVRSSLRDRALPRELVVFGEVGLAGEIRPVPGGEERIREAAKHGFRQALIPAANRPRRAPAGLEVAAVADLGEALSRIDALEGAAGGAGAG